MTDLGKSVHQLQEDMKKISCYDINDDSEEEDDIDDILIIPPSTSFGFLLDFRILEHQMSRLSCDHQLLLFCQKRSKIIIKCHICHFQANQTEEDAFIDSDTVDDSSEKLNVVDGDDSSLGELVIDIGDDQQPSDDVSCNENNEKNDNSELETLEALASELDDYNEEKALNASDDDDEIDKLLMDSPENGKKEERIVINEVTKDKVELFPNEKNEEVARKLTEDKVDSEEKKGDKIQMFLKLRDLKDLLPSVPGLPQFTSNKLQDGTNPLENIPFYDEDLSLVEEEPPTPPPRININIVSSQRAAPAMIRHSNQGHLSQQYNRFNIDAQQRQIFHSQGVVNASNNVHGPVHVRPVSPSPTGGVRIRTVTVKVPTQQLHQGSPANGTSPQISHNSRATIRPVQNPVNNLPQRMPPRGGMVMPSIPMQQSQFYQQQPLGIHNPRYSEPMQTLTSSLASMQNDPRARAVMSRLSHPEQPLYYDPRLPQGWRREIQRAENGQCRVVVFDGQGRAFRNQDEIRSSYPSGLDSSKVDFSVFGKIM